VTYEEDPVEDLPKLGSDKERVVMTALCGELSAAEAAWPGRGL
jgi:hypothetical protein